MNDKDKKLIWEKYITENHPGGQFARVFRKLGYRNPDEGGDPFDKFSDAPHDNSTEWRKIRDMLNKQIRPLVKLETPKGDMWMTAAGFGQGKGKGWPSDPDDDELSIYGYLKNGDDININVSNSNIKIIDIVT